MSYLFWFNERRLTIHRWLNFHEEITAIRSSLIRTEEWIQSLPRDWIKWLVWNSQNVTYNDTLLKTTVDYNYHNIVTIWVTNLIKNVYYYLHNSLVISIAHFSIYWHSWLTMTMTLSRTVLWLLCLFLKYLIFLAGYFINATVY